MEWELQQLDHEVDSLHHARDPPTLGRVAHLHGRLQNLEIEANQLYFTSIPGKPALSLRLAGLRRRRKAILERCGGLPQAWEDLRASLQGDAFKVNPEKTQGGTAIHGPETEVHSFITHGNIEA